MTTLYIARHGQTLLNLLGRAQGWCDSPLTPEGRESAKALGSSLSAIPFESAYASDASRAVETARLCLDAAGQADVAVHTDTRLREWALGSMEAQPNDAFFDQVAALIGPPNSFPDMNARLPEVAQAILDADETGTAEPFERIQARALSALRAAAKRSRAESNVLVVTHAFLIKTLLFAIDAAALAKTGSIGNATVVRVECEDGRLSLKEPPGPKAEGRRR